MSKKKKSIKRVYKFPGAQQIKQEKNHEILDRVKNDNLYKIEKAFPDHENNMTIPREI